MNAWETSGLRTSRSYAGTVMSCTKPPGDNHEHRRNPNDPAYQRPEEPQALYRPPHKHLLEVPSPGPLPAGCRRSQCQEHGRREEASEDEEIMMPRLLDLFC